MGYIVVLRVSDWLLDLISACHHGAQHSLSLPLFLFLAAGSLALKRSGESIGQINK